MLPHASSTNLPYPRPQVDVKHFLNRQGSNAYSPSNHRRYTYLLWVGRGGTEEGPGGRFQPVWQDFYKFPTPEYNWNYLDELVCGYNDELRCVRACLVCACWIGVGSGRLSWLPPSLPLPMYASPRTLTMPSLHHHHHHPTTTHHHHQTNRPETKYRRKLLAVCPGKELLGPLGSSSSPLARPPPPQQLEAYLGKLRKLLEHAESRRLKGSPPLDVKVAQAVQVRGVATNECML